MSEIQEILKKHDIAGVVFLSSPSKMEFLYHLETSWTCILQNDEEGRQLIRFKSLLKEYPAKEKQIEVAQYTIGTLAGFEAMSAQAEESFGMLLKKIGETYNHGTVIKDDNE